MKLVRIVLLAALFVSSLGASLEQQKSKAERVDPLKELFGFTLPPLIPDLNPDPAIPNTIGKSIRTFESPNIALPTISARLPDPRDPPTRAPNRIDEFNFPTLPAIKLPDLIPKNLPTLAPIKLPTIKIPDLLPTALPTIKIPDLIPKELPTLSPIKIPTIKIPDLIPTALPTGKIPEAPTFDPTRVPDRLPTVKLPDLIPKILPTLPPIHIPTIKIPTIPPIHIPTIKIPDLIPTGLPKLPTIHIPTLPHILPTALPTLFPPAPAQGGTPNTPYTLPYPLPSDVAPIPFLVNSTDSPELVPNSSELFEESPPTGSLICDVCQNAVTVVKTRFQLFEKAVRNNANVVLTNVCKIIENFPALAILSAPCNLFKSNLIDNAFKKLDDWEAKVTPQTVCTFIRFCKKA